ncbi:multidrug MFS transporter [Neisseria arctica]|uniref:Multidrug MFS transporter n=1 Tax=Neisseria arctica TaxID=1470200 RepID=A0A0J0YPT6_9NEIS|nr:YdcF family protein [Neisseria arctica]KLT72140.1 multidrug MFS transporter [Neisseria arctica]UOO86840.1 YdcF family protein [Neisseria arctica]
MVFSLTRSRNGLRYALLRGFLLSLFLVSATFAYCVWQVWHIGNQTLAADARADAAVVLGAAAWDTRPSPVFRERINHALALYQSGRVEKLVFTGGSPKPGFMTEAEVGRRYAIKQGVRSRDIIFENTSRDTYHNLFNIRPLLRSHDIQTVVIVSDPYHLARAAAIADDLGINAYTSATPTSRYSESRKKREFLMQESYALFLYYGSKLADDMLGWLRIS